MKSAVRAERPKHLGRGQHRRIMGWLRSGPRVVPDVIGSDPFAIVAWEKWMERSACLDVDPELFYPDQGAHSQSRAARKICAQCPVNADCLDYALAHHELYGIWGGMGLRERQAEARRRAS